MDLYCPEWCKNPWEACESQESGEVAVGKLTHTLTDGRKLEMSGGKGTQDCENTEQAGGCRKGVMPTTSSPDTFTWGQQLRRWASHHTTLQVLQKAFEPRESRTKHRHIRENFKTFMER